MKLVVGLGNPGKEYENTRHNVGFETVDALAEKLNVSFDLSAKFNSQIGKMKSEDDEVVLVKPQTFMNKSGDAVVRIVNFYKVELDDVWVVHDDLDIALGTYKIHKGRGPRDHKGVGSIEKSLGSKEFWRIRVGVESRKQQGNTGIPGEKYVLMKLVSAERGEFDRVVGRVVSDLIERLDA